MNRLPTNNKKYRFNKHLHIIEKYNDLLRSLKDYLSLIWYKLNNERKLITIFSEQIKSKLKKITLKKSLFKYNRSLLLKLLNLSIHHRFIVLNTAFQIVFAISLANREGIIVK
jgi:hypothetical protein